MIIRGSRRFGLVIIWLLISMLVAIATFTNASGLEFKPAPDCDTGSIFWRYRKNSISTIFDCNDLTGLSATSHLRTSLKFIGSGVGKTESFATIINSQAGQAVSSAHIIKRNHNTTVIVAKTSSIECSILPALILAFAALLMFELAILATKFFLH